MNQQNIAVVTILYNSPPETIHNIESYLPFFSRVYLIDNSAEKNIEFQKACHPKIIYCFDGKNDGISKRLNEAAIMALNEGYKYLLTMDQDSCFDGKMLTDYLRCFESFIGKSEIAIYGVEHDKRLWKQGSCNSVNEVLITSGSIINLEIHKKLNGFDDNLFIDLVDTEYYLKAIDGGYSAIKFNNILMNHSIGFNKLSYSLKSFKATARSLHTPLRIYYMVRNYLYVKSRYDISHKPIIRLIKRNLFISLKNNLIYNKERLQVLSNIITGYLHYKKGKMGKWRR